MTIGLDEQIRRVADAAFAETTAVTVPVAGTTSERPVRRRLLLVAASVALVAGALTALALRNADDDVVPVEPGPTPSVEATSSDFADRFTAGGALREIPLTGNDGSGPAELRLVTAADLAGIADLVGVTRPTEIDMQGPPTEWGWLVGTGSPEPDGTPVVAFPVGRLVLDGYTTSEAFDAELGWSAADVDAFVSAERQPDYMPWDVVTLRTDLGGLADESGDDGIIDVGTAADGVPDVNDQTELRPLGVAWRMGIDADRSLIAVSHATPPVAAWLDDVGPTWADVPELAAAADALDRGGELYALKIMATDFSLAAVEGDVPGQRPAEDFLIEQRFSALAFGWSGIGDTQRTTIAYVFDDAASAVASVEAIERLYSPGAPFVEGIAIGDMFVVSGVEAVDRVVIVSGSAAPGAAPAAISDAFVDFGPLTRHR